MRSVDQNRLQVKNMTLRMVREEIDLTERRIHDLKQRLAESNFIGSNTIDAARRARETIDNLKGSLVSLRRRQTLLQKLQKRAGKKCTA